MDILGLLKRISQTNNGCRECAFLMGHRDDCQIKAAIDALEDGRLVVVDMQTAVNYPKIIIQKEQGT